MVDPAEPSEAKKHFLDVADAEVVHGPDVIADKVSGAMKDADRFGVPSVKPPLSEALSKARRASASAGPGEGEPSEQNALSAQSAEVDENAGSAEMLEPGGAARPG